MMFIKKSSSAYLIPPKSPSSTKLLTLVPSATMNKVVGRQIDEKLESLYQLSTDEESCLHDDNTRLFPGFKFMNTLK
ncbi:hypothetical protein SS50377_27355 [Spironucleus salmonicida]|uniref:Uncharacterized protein n=1 Tax=Spironucleus salmonicida TaxID=348837 RepID=V6LGC1_9EUKA|nr:hypothetical protein SS50377_27355 [Spironucleus salmonicida]|eukprot:EST43343.1 Hypothetical protein SS50377_17021 [Spironucleus salmonicida]